MDKKTELTKKLEQYQAFNNIFISTDYQKHLLPLIEEAISNKSWPDPTKFTDEQFKNEYFMAYAKVKAYTVIRDLMANAEKNIEVIRKELAQPERKYATGTNLGK